jgi:hypothetical protein
VLLNADAFLPLESPLTETPFEAAIYFDLKVDQAISSQLSAIWRSQGLTQGLVKTGLTV